MFDKVKVDNKDVYVLIWVLTKIEYKIVYSLETTKEI